MKSYLIRVVVVIGVITMSLATNSLAVARTDTGANHDKPSHTTHRSHQTSHKSSHHTRSHHKTHTAKAKSTLSNAS